MLKKLSAAFVAMSLIVVTHPALAQASPKRIILGQLIVNVPNTKPSVVDSGGGLQWTFTNVGNNPAAIPTLDGIAVTPRDLKKGMECSVTGIQIGSGKFPVNAITSLACKSGSVVLTLPPGTGIPGKP